MDITKDPSGEPTQETSGQEMENQQSASGAEINQRDTVAYSTYKKALGEAKRAKEEARLLSEQKRRWEEQQLEAEGKKDEVINRLRQELEEKERVAKEEQKRRAFDRVNSQVISEASKRGCKDPNSLAKLLRDEYASLDYDKDLNIVPQDMDLLFEKATSKHAYFFEKAAPKVADGVPTTPQVQPGKSLNDLSLEDKIKLLGAKTRK
jgi:gas vesicle protein